MSQQNEPKRRLHAAVMAGLLAMSMGAPTIALAAATNTPSVEAQDGTGQTDLTMILQDTREHGGTADDTTNPDTDPVDGLGDNLAFTVPASINYVVKADGNLIAPAAGAAFIENRSNFTTHVSKVQVTAENAFSFVEDATNTTTANAVQLSFGPASGPANAQLNAASYTSKTAVTAPSAWNMAATNGAHTDTSDRSDELQISTSGKVANISNDITTRKTFGKIHWYLTPGQAS